MGALALTLFMMFAAAQLMSSTEAQSSSVRLCSEVFTDLTRKGIRVFVDEERKPSTTDNSAPKVEFCVNLETFRVERYLYCQERASALLLGYDTADTKNDLSQVVNVAQLRDETNNSNIILVCVTPPQPPTPSPSPPPSPPSPPSVGRCPRGPTRKNQYLRQDRTKLCRLTCSFGVAVFGIPTGTRTRRIYRCCSGEEPKLVSRASRLYTCSP